MSPLGSASRRLIGATAYGTVYRARKHRSSEIVALKVMRPDWAGHLEKMSPYVLREITILNALQHENIIRFEAVAVNDSPGKDCSDCSDGDGDHCRAHGEYCYMLRSPFFYIVMEYAEYVSPLIRFS